MTSPIGMNSYKKNPMKMAKQVSSQFGPGSNSDQAKANRLLKQAYAEKESLRGKSGM